MSVNSDIACSSDNGPSFLESHFLSSNRSHLQPLGN